MLFRSVCAILFTAAAALAQGDTLSLAQAPATSAGTVTLNLSLKSGAGQQPAGVQWTLSYSSVDFTAIQVRAGPAAVAAGKAVDCAGSASAYLCLLAGVNSTAVADGVVAVVTLTVSPSTPDTTSMVQLENVMAASGDGNSISISGTGATVTLKSSTGLSVPTQSLQFVFTVGGANPASRAVQITSSAGGALQWSATWKAAWLSVTPSSGSTPGTITVSVAPGGLSPSMYSDTIEISAGGGAGGQLAITVTLIVQTSPAASLFVPVFPCRVVDTRNADGALGGPSIAGGSSREFVIPDGPCHIPSTATAYSLNVAVVPKHALGYLTIWPTGQSQPEASTLNSDGRIKSNAAIVPAGTDGAVSVFATDTTDVILDINGYMTASSDSAGLAFYPVTPCRVLDTRLKQSGLLGGPALKAQATRAFPIDQSACGMPANSEAYSLNFAAIPKGPLGYLTAWPAGNTPQPVVASLNDVTGTVAANAVIVPAGMNGEVNVFATNATDLVIDSDGYFAAPGPGGLLLYNLPPCRVLDTRNNGGAPFIGIKEVIVKGICGVPSTAQAYVFNVTVVPAGKFGYLSLWPEGEMQPTVATLNAVDGAITSNLAIVPVLDGVIDAYASDHTHLILDIFGYFGP